MFVTSCVCVFDSILEFLKTCFVVQLLFYEMLALLNMIYPTTIKNSKNLFAGRVVTVSL
jgi:hypothetical protein